MSDYSKKQESTDHIKKDKQGNVEFRSNEREGIIKGAKQEDQLQKLNKEKKSLKDNTRSKPVNDVGEGKQDTATEP